MLSFPQPPDSELVEGCPLVRLHDSTAEVTAFLKAIFDPEFFMPFPARTTFDTIVGCLRLSHKYGVDYLRRRALMHLSSGYRTTLSEWDSHIYDEDPRLDLPPLVIMTWPDPETLTFKLCVIQLAREVDALWVLPVAFYRLAASFRKLGRAVFNGAVYNGVPTSLSIQDQDSFITGLDAQIGSTSDILRFFSHPRDIPGCTTPTRCCAGRLAAIDNSRESLDGCISIPLSVWAECDWDFFEGAVCSMCLPVLRQTHQAARQAFWDKLPEIYGLPPWDELEQMKVAAIGLV
ncbi:hypothetical protein C8R44DRAFT_878670 [Mycena epipterygia]|nr:hypothetical protein C8R44DRAFT_878670 [Mycena epipterygia]